MLWMKLHVKPYCQCQLNVTGQGGLLVTDWHPWHALDREEPNRRTQHAGQQIGNLFICFKTYL